MWLARIKDSTSQFADVISKTLDVDVLIVDHNLKTVSNTFRYFDRFTLIRKVSLIGQVISTGEVLAVDDKSNVSACKDCIDFYECEMAGFIGVPIKYKGLVVGAIALIFPKQRIAQAFQQVRTSIEFLESMADLLASKLQNADDYNTLNVIKREREVLMDSIADAIVSTDDIGYISYYNKQFAKYFHLEQSCEGEFIQDIVPHRVIGDFLEKQLESKNKLIFLDLKEGSFYGFASCNNISINGNCNGMLFTFKPISNVNAELNSVKVEAVPSFHWAKKRLFSDTLTDEAKRLAVTNKPVLICGEHGTGADILANAIHNFSSYNASPMVLVNCNRIYQDLQEQSIFGELGKLQLAHKGTIFFQEINHLALYLQKKLLNFMKTGAVLQVGTHGVHIDVRMIFSTSEDLEKLVHEGSFNDELCYDLLANKLLISPLREDKPGLKRLIASDIDFYREKYQKPAVTFSPEALAKLYHYTWPENVQEVERVIDQAVYHCRDIVTPEYLVQSNLIPSGQGEVKRISELEQEKITALLKSNCNKDQIARLLGISRATLYRKIKNFNL